MDLVEPLILCVDYRQQMGNLQLLGEDKRFDVVYVVGLIRYESLISDILFPSVSRQSPCLLGCKV
jgi:hypothetical protein